MRRRSTLVQHEGLTLVEILLSALFGVSLLFVGYLATDRCIEMFRRARVYEEVSMRGNGLLQRLAQELRSARRTALQPLAPGGASALVFQRSEGLRDGGIAWGPSERLRWERERDERDDGQDDDGDGLIDEGEVAWLERPGEPGGRPAVWARDAAELWPGETFDGSDENDDGLIDERGLCFSLAGDVLTIRAALQGAGPGRSVVTKTFETSVLLRN